MTTIDKYTLLKEFASKAGCVHTQRKARSLWARLARVLTEDERRRLSSAWGEHEWGLGRSELDFVAGNIASEWKAIDHMASEICAEEDARILDSLSYGVTTTPIKMS